MGLSDVETDEALMRRFQAGNAEAFESLFTKYSPPLINFVYRFLGSRDEAEDVAQNVFLRIYRNRDRYDVSRPFRPWLFSIAARLATDQARKRKRHAEAPLEGAENRADPAAPSPEGTQAQRELAQEVRTALATLPENQRIAVLLCRFEEMSYEDIGKAMDLSVSSVKSLLFRARHTLKKRLAAQAEISHK